MPIPVLDNLSDGSLEKYSAAQFKYSSAGLSDKEKSIVFLVGYAFPTFSLRLRFSKKSNPNSPEILQKYLDILAARKLGDVKQELPEHKLVNTINRGRLMENYSGSFPLSFCIVEQVFKKQKGTCSSKIHGMFITKTVL